MSVGETKLGRMKASSAREFAEWASSAGIPRESWVYIATLSYMFGKKLEVEKFRLKSKSFRDLERNAPSQFKVSWFSVQNSQSQVTTLDQLQFICELAISSDDAKLTGAFYTPSFIVEELVNNTLGKVKPEIAQMSFIDPCCGSGNFLRSAISHIAVQTSCSLSAASARVAGLDINPSAILCAESILDLMCFEENGGTSQARLLCLDSAVTPVSEQIIQLGAKAGFASLATNPPYVKVQTLPLPYRLSLEKSNPIIATGSYSLATIFQARIHEYLAPGGLAGVITMNNIFTSLSGISIRRKWQTEKLLSRIIDFRHYKVFQASAYTCLIYSDTVPKDYFEFAAISSSPSARSIADLKMSEISFESLAEKKWRMSSSSMSSLLFALESESRNLATISEIRVGIATLADKAFIVSKAGGTHFGFGGDGVKRELEPGAIRPLVKVSDLNEGSDLTFRGVIFPYIESPKGRHLMKEADFRNQFPQTFAHLRSWAAVIDKPSRQGQQFHEWGRRQSMSSPGPKLFTKTFDKKPTFHLDTSDALFCNGYSISLREDHHDNLPLLNGLRSYLQSRFMIAYALMTSFEIDGGYQCYQKNFIEKFIVPSQKTLELIHGPIEPGSDTEIAIAKELGVRIKDIDQCLEDYGFSVSPFVSA